MRISVTVRVEKVTDNHSLTAVMVHLVLYAIINVVTAVCSLSVNAYKCNYTT